MVDAPLTPTFFVFSDVYVQVLRLSLLLELFPDLTWTVGDLLTLEWWSATPDLE